MTAQLLVYGFGPGGNFQGQLVGAMERLESGGALRVADALFVSRDAGTGELVAVSLGGGRMDAMVGTLLDFRLDEAARRRTTERTLTDDATRALAESLAPGTALAAVLVEHVWAGAMADAATRTGGHLLVDGSVEADGLSALGDELAGAARSLALSAD